MALSQSVLRSRLRGSLWGLATGDALGAPYEFKTRGNYTVTNKMEKSYTFLHKGEPLLPGTFTDDTSLALCLAASLNDRGTLVWEDAARKMTKWHTDGYMSALGYCFDIGNATLHALEAYRVHFQFHRNAPLEFSGSTSRSSSGNGSLMRLAPVPVFFHSNPALAVENAAIQSKITHGSDLAVESCQLASAQIVGFLTEPETTSLADKKAKVLGAKFIPDGVQAFKFETEEVSDLWEGTWKTKQEDGIVTSGYVIASHEAALWALWNTHTFEEGMLQLMAMGGDVDTVCAIYGQIAGACYGIDAIPSTWLNDLQKQDVLKDTFDTLVESALSSGSD